MILRANVIRAVLVTAVAISIAACGDEDEETDNAALAVTNSLEEPPVENPPVTNPPPAPPPPVASPPPPPPPPPPIVSNPNRDPTISGAPAGTVLAGDSYNFVPTASDQDGDSLSFSVSGLPSWASFDSGNGALTGTPVAGNVGTFNNISITVTDGSTSATLGPFSVEVVPIANGSAILSWMSPTENTDGTPLNDLAGFIIYWGSEPDDLRNSVTLNNPGLTSYVVENLAQGTTHYFATTAFNSAGLESSFSNAASKTIP